MRKLGIAAAGLALAAVSNVAVAAFDRGATDVASDVAQREAPRIRLDPSADNTDVFTA